VALQEVESQGWGGNPYGKLRLDEALKPLQMLRKVGCLYIEECKEDRWHNYPFSSGDEHNPINVPSHQESLDYLRCLKSLVQGILLVELLSLMHERLTNYARLFERCPKFGFEMQLPFGETKDERHRRSQGSWGRRQGPELVSPFK
jgi:hypothetical protein